MKNGCILNGGVGSGKSRTSLYYYFSQQGGSIDPDGDVGGVIPGGSGGSGVDGLHYDKETGELYLTANGYRASESVTIVSGSGDSSCSDDCVTEDELHEITIEEFDALWDSVFKGENNG